MKTVDPALCVSTLLRLKNKECSNSNESEWVQHMCITLTQWAHPLTMIRILVPSKGSTDLNI